VPDVAALPEPTAPVQNDRNAPIWRDSQLPHTT